jgi:uncharacterized membrane protein
METINLKNKSLLEKIAPFVLIIGVVILGYFLFTKFKPTTSNTTQTSTVEIVQVQVDTGFLTSDAFTKLKFIADSSVFNEVTGDVTSGKEDPFAP